MKTYRLEISKFIYSFLLSLIFFSVFWKEVCLNLYLLIYVSVFFLALILLEHKKNAEHLFRLMILGTSISIGYSPYAMTTNQSIHIQRPYGSSRKIKINCSATTRRKIMYVQSRQKIR